MRRLWSALLAIARATALSARAEDGPIGFIKTLSGTATVTHGNATSAAALAVPVYENDLVQTGGDGELGISSATIRGYRSAQAVGSSSSASSSNRPPSSMVSS
jgi:hypothetical protein